jgi:diguanylate cyclase (GGDEF)-like protein
MLLAAAEASMQGLAASGCQILAVGGQSADLPSDLSAAVTVGSCGEAASLTPLVAEMIADPDRAARVMVQDGWSLLLAPTIYGGDLIGAILLWRSPAQPAWSSQEAQLIGTLAGQLAAAIDQRANYLRLLDASRTDPLTGLFNRRAFDEELHRRLVRLKRDGRLAALLYVDLDNFKVVNDLRGHALGDEALRHVADILRSNTRSSDLLARIGGDEFAVWLEDVTESDAIKRARTFLVAGTSLTAYSGNDRRPLQMSIGIAPHDPARPENIDALMKRADAAMYQIKRSGKGNFAVSRFVDGGGA